ncbi:SusC/RagA family TonB-linked outer membrane protein [Rufibacter glacialis]|uniref:SusC/RagA family TonB-linked outer membrane protein n=1 Tax=Rufibacter glacialis TaxID=1259555 RepID=A0A5M8Q7B4_9BACT|nr:SusC/RagA family TonB-linked outer membrane protein [Rufibacter glacialis]KAA6430766.1 SusC/RagA family TonB-linked outer membrane protein [Rufibacter glacialis]GGK86549.1 SusC/RagA family TonB-linked outer membrane protein [Rufibacter glacialis]
MRKIYFEDRARKATFLCTLLVALLSQLPARAQAGYTITGLVTDARTKSPLPGVVVKMQGSNNANATATDATGRYTLRANLPAGSYQLEFTFVGFKPLTRQISLGATSSVALDAQLNEDIVGLDEVVVTGTSVATSKKQLGNAISTVSAEAFENSVVTSVDQALAGKVAGAQITQNSGNPAGGISVRLRGTSTVVGSGDPLYIVDGVVINNNSSELIDLGGYSQNRLVDINPNDIDRIEIIKGAAAAAIYGSRASNGVVQIFTKRGKEGKPKVDVSTQFRVSELRKKLEYNDYPFRFVNTTPTDLTQVPVQRYDYQDKIFRTAYGTDNNVSVSGGSANTQYFLSGSYLKNQGIVKNTDFTRGGGRLRLDQTLTDWLSISLGTNYVISTSQEVPNGGLNEAYGALTGFIFSNNFVNPEPVNGVFPSTTVTGIVTRTNPLEAINRFDFQQRTSRFIGDFQMQVTPVENLNINYVLGYDNSTTIATGFIPVGNTTPSYTTGFSRRADETRFLLNNDLNISYRVFLADWLESTTGVGGTIQLDKTYRTGINATQLGPIAQTINSGATIVPGEERSEANIMGFFAQQTFGLGDRLFITGAGRYDVSSVFGSEERWQFYPKVSGSYLISNETFWQGLADIIPILKLRASYGQAGNLSAIGAYSRYTNYNPVSLPGQPGVVASTRLGNSGIKPERQTETEIGADMSFLKGRLGFEFSVYHKNVKDLILDINLAPSTGFGVQYANVGTLTNKGFELLLTGSPIFQENTKWTSTFIYSRNKNEVNNIPGGVLTFPGGFGQVAAVNGYPLGAFYSTYFARNEDGSLLLTPAGLPQAERVGRTAAGQPTGATKPKVIGDPNPDWTASLTNEITIGGNLSFRAQVDASYGFDVFNFTRRVGERDFYGGLAGYEPELRGEVPKGTSAALFGIFENYIEDGSFIKLRELSVAYDVKPAFLGNRNVRLTLAGRNLFSIDDYSGYDPEVNAAGQTNAVRGFDFVEVPIPRTYALGLQVSF